MNKYHVIQWIDETDTNDIHSPVVRMIDQRLIPHEIKYNNYADVLGIANAIRTMVIRGAPAIGLAAGYGMAIAAVYGPPDLDSLRTQIASDAEVLKSARPTAVNLFWAIERMLKRLDDPALKSAGPQNEMSFEANAR